ncbi:hypothetical protein CPC08DRAFT_703967 [Agrocybe pediades]|nr:hypothetical protein CPC08DRAFT_703967 [Agrocybe pediades]
MDGARTAVHRLVHPKPWRDEEDSGRRVPVLPPELHALILTELNGEKATLEQCALTCKLYRHLAQKLLFKSVVLEFSYMPTGTPADRFIEILDASSQIAHYVTKLSIRESGNHVRRRGTDQTQPQLYKSIPLVTALINVVDLVIGWETDNFEFSHWTRSSLLTMMAKFANLLSLTLVNTYGAPLQIFNHLHRLETFNLKDVTFFDDPDVRAAQVFSSSRIKHMDLKGAWLRNMGTIYPFFRKRRFGAGHLESLSLDMNCGWEELPPAEFEAATWLISSNLGSLKVLDITISEHVPVILTNDEPVFDLSTMPLLEEWSLGGVVCNTDEDADTGPIGLGWLARHLETIPAGKRYKSVILRPNIIGADGVMDDCLDFEGLKYFESLIMENFLPRTDFFAINFTVWNQDEAKVANKQMKKHLPTLQSLGLLHFEDWYSWTDFGDDQ